MAVFNRILDFFNGDMGPARPQFQPPMSPQPYVDDIFDPLFNREVVEYNRNLYGPLGAIPAGFAQMWDNALTGQKGILGPGMGILSTFGRSMDKADDFILGGLTEGVNAIGRFTGTNQAPTNPISNIFVKDQDYEGSDLMAAMGNAMGKLAGGVRLDRGDFNDLPDRIQSGFLNLATDPGFMGSRLVRDNPANRMAAALDSYDNFMAKVAGNTAFPGMQAMARSGLDRLNLALGTVNARPIEHMTIKHGEPEKPSVEPVVNQMLTDYVKKGNLNVAENPELAKTMRAIRRKVAKEYPDLDKEAAEAMALDIQSNFKTKLNEIRAKSKQLAQDDMKALTSLANSGDLEMILDLQSDNTSGSKFYDVLEDTPEDTTWQLLEDELMERERISGASYEDARDIAARDIEYYRDRENMSVSEVWDRVFPGVPMRAVPKFDSPVEFKASELAYQKKSMREINAALTAADMKLFDASDYVRRSTRKDAVYEKSLLRRAERTLESISNYLNGSDPYQTDLKDGVRLPKPLRYLIGNLNNLKTKFKGNKADAYDIAKIQYDLSDAILNNLKYFNDADGKPYVDWAYDVQAIKKAASPKILDDINGKTSEDMLSFDETLGIPRDGPEVQGVHSDADVTSTQYDMIRSYANKPTDYRDSMMYVLNQYVHVKPENMKTVNQWNAFIKKHNIPETIDVTLKPGSSLTVAKSYINKARTPLEAKALVEFADMTPTVKQLEVPSTKEELRLTHKPYKEKGFLIFEFDKSDLAANKTINDSVFGNANFFVADRNKWNKEFQRYERGTYPRYTSEFDMSSIPGDKIHLAYDPSGSDYLSGIKYDPKHKHYIVTSNDTLKLFSTRKPEAIGKSLSVVRTKFLKDLDTFESRGAQLKHDKIVKVVGGMDIPNDIFKDTSPEVIARFVEDPKSLEAMEADEAERYFTEDFIKRFNLPDDMPHEELVKEINDKGSPKDISSLALVDKCISIDASLKRGGHDVGVLASQEAKEAINMAKKLKANTTKPDGSYDGTAFVNAQKFRWEHEDQIIHGKDFLDYLRHTTNGVVRIGLTDGDKARYSGIKDVLTHNAQKLNAASKHGNLIKVNKFKVGDTKFIEVGFDYDNPMVKKAMKQNIGGLFPKTVDLEDVVIQRASTVSAPKEVQPYIDLFNKIEGVAQPIYKRMGGTAPQNSWMLHAVSDTSVGRKVFTDISEASPFAEFQGMKARKSFDKIVGAPSTRGKLGVADYRRSYLGDFDAYKGGFTDDPEALATRSFSDGVMRSVYTNQVQEFFFNKQLRIPDWFDSPKTLADFLRATDAEGNRAGNLSSFTVVSPVLKDGVLTGIRRYDSLSDAALEEAFKDPNAVVLPNSMFASMDRLLKKDKSLIYKPNTLGRFANYIHHYVSIPIKFGILSNLGFLAGNVQDAYFKQAETMAKAYGTTIEEELANVAMAYRHTMDLHNEFDKTFEKYTKALLDVERINEMTGSAQKTNDMFGETIKVLKSAEKLGTEIDPSEIMNNPKYFREWWNFVSHPNNKWYLPDSHDMKVARLYTFLQVRQNTATFENNTLDLADVYDAERLNEYDTPENLIDRVLYGNPASEHFTYGLMLNNPFSNWILRKSNGFESFTRSASIINSLMHQGWDEDKIADVLGKSGDDFKIAKQRLRSDSVNAVNLMHHSNFDYENVTDFMNGASKVMPFPTFYLKNISHWADTLANNPEMLDDIISFHEGLWQNRDVSEDEFAAQAKGRGAYPVGGRTPFGTGIVKQTPINSMFSAFSAVNNAKEDAAYRINPLARPLTRHLQKKEDVKYRPYSTNPYEKNVKMGDPQFSNLAYMFHQLNPYDRFFNTYLRTPKKIATNSYQASDFLPSVFQPDFGKKSRK